jgi:hypothetical protein
MTVSIGDENAAPVQEEVEVAPVFSLHCKLF